MSKKINGYIYELICPITKDPVYVGSTFTPEHRFKTHISNIKSGRSEMYEYFRQLGVKPEMNIIEVVKVNQYTERLKLVAIESLCISAYIEYGYRLFNERSKKVSKYIECF